MFKIQPVYKDYLWGGNKLKEAYGKESNLDIVVGSFLRIHQVSVKLRLTEKKRALQTISKKMVRRF